MKKNLSVFLMVIIVISLCACSNATSQQSSAPPATQPEAAQSSEPPATENEAPTQPETPETRVVTDMIGREVEIPSKVNRIVSLSNVPRMVVYLGVADRVVGYSGMDPNGITPVTAYAYVTQELWKDIPIVGTDSGGNTDYYPEMILATKPDVIMGAFTEDVAKNLETQTGAPVISVATGTLFGEDYNQALRLIAKVCGVEERAEEIISYIDACLADLDNRTSGIPDSDKPTSLSAAATFKGAHGIEGVRIKDPVLDSVNAINVASEIAAANNAAAVEVDKEQILVWNADYIFCDYSGIPLVMQDYAANPGYYAQLKAYNDGNIYQHPSSTSYYTNLEVPLVNCYFVGSILYPEQFADVDLNAKADEIFKFFLGVDDFLSELEGVGAGYAPVDFGAN